jgi:3-isopropylmalate/(R)-2-methylmalate dehydratase small subunit
MLRRMLLEGLDEIAVTLTMQPQIETYRARDAAKRPWVYRRGAG